MSHQFKCEDCSQTFNVTATIYETPINHPSFTDGEDFSLCTPCSIKFERGWKMAYGASYPYTSSSEYTE